jgi:RHS repeat-associated protein
MRHAECKMNHASLHSEDKRMWRDVFCLCLFIFFACFNKASLAADKNGVSPNTISVPKGPGSIEGLGESFQPTLNTGTAKYAIALKVPPGTAGLAPDLKLLYEAGNGNGPLGFGWEFGFDYVQCRTDHGVPTYGQIPGFPRADTFITDAKEELVPLTNGYYFCKNEGVFTRYQQVVDHWEATLPTGTKLQFGLTDLARIQDTNSSPPHVFGWLLEREIDTHNNVIVYSYTNFPGSNNLNQKYLSSITYGPGQPPWNNFHFVQFVYENRHDWFEDCRGGFPVRTGKRLKSIVIGTHGPNLPGHLPVITNGITGYLDRRYDLSYSSQSSHWSFLSAIQPVGADGASTLPASSFGYTVQDPPDVLSAGGRQLFGTNEPVFVMDNTLVDLIDANGDGLPDILKTDADGGSHAVYLNRGETLQGGQRYINWSAPITVGGDPLAQMYTLSQASVHLADMDGDGLADLVVRTAFDQVFYFLNQGTNAWAGRQLMAIPDFAPPAPFGETNVRTADFDFDKRTDIIQSDGTEYQVWLNLGNGQYFDKITVPQTNGFDFALPQVQIADFNGDRVPDVAWIRPTEVVVTAGLGYGRFGPAIHVPVPDFPPGSSRSLGADLMARAKLTDMNGDGLADLVIERVPGNELWCWINQGNYTFSGPKVITDMPSDISANAVVRWADINGNGTIDLIYADSLATPRIVAVDIGELLNGGSPPNALVVISNGIGRATRIGYQSSSTFAVADLLAGQPWPDPVPFPVNVVAAVTNYDSLGHQYVSQFAYHNGYYDSGEHQFRGFGRVEQVDLGDVTAPTLVTRSFFDTGRNYQAMKGKLLILDVEEANGSLFWAETNSWTVPPVTLYVGTNGTNVSYAHPTATVKVISELGQGTRKQLESSSDYDHFGNETFHADYGVVEHGDPTAGQDERIVTTVFALNTNAWILRHPARQEISGLTNGVLSRVEYYYDDDQFRGNNFGQVAVGNLNLRREWRDASSPKAFIEAVRTKYDPYGNPVTLLDPLAVANVGSVDFSKGHGREIAYDTDFHTYPVTETIRLGGSSQDLVYRAAYDEGFGTVVSVTDFNSNQTTFGYDVFGRLINLVKPPDTSGYPTVEYDYDLAVPVSSGGVVNYVETRQLDTDPTSGGDHLSHYHISRQFIDGLGRKLMTKTEAEPATNSGAPRVVISEATLYNTRGKPAAILNPCFSLINNGTLTNLLAFENIEASGWQGSFELYSNLVNLTLPNAHKSSLVYDATLREIRHINPDGTFTSNRFEPLLTRSFDENQTVPTSSFNGACMVHYNDGLGRLVQVDEVTHLTDSGNRGSLASWTTRYQYDLNDQLTQITDSQNNVKTMTYDALKRKTFMNDPDRGVMNYDYDAAGNLIQTIDAKNQLITYTYDGANRILTEDYHDEGLSFSANKSYVPSSPISPINRPDVAYFYDAPAPNLDQGDNTLATARNTRGMLAYVWDLSGEEHNSYDSRGRIEYTVKRIPDPIFYPTLQGPKAPTNPQLVSYKTAFDHDSMDRLTRLVYPDNDQVTYQYNERGLLKRIPGGPNGSIISNIVYHPSAQQAVIDYGNGIRTAYEHDNRLRLSHLATFRNFVSTNPSPQLIDFLYDFDGVSNIRQITDNRSGSAVPAGDKRRNTQLFQYDDLYRLTQVQYSFSLPGQSVGNDGTIDYRYDRIGNMLSQTSTLNDTDPMTGLPVANLGTMTSGGNAGRFSRHGRTTADPGPHALSQIASEQVGVTNRIYNYDANGNMLTIDGLACTWDFKDRLGTCENAKMRVEYSYDYTGRRIAKRVKEKQIGGDTSLSLTNPASQLIVTLYPDAHFEVRDRDAPTKYVFASGTRVARVTGSLSGNPRIQRLRVYPGWNLCAVAVTVSNALSQFSSPGLPGIVKSVYSWLPQSSNYRAVTAGTTLTEGTVVWVSAAAAANLSLLGLYSSPNSTLVSGAGSFNPGAGLEVWCSSNALPATVTGWMWNASAASWLNWFEAPLVSLSVFPRLLAPGEAFFARPESPAVLEVPEPALSIRYYHEDHLGSTCCLSDGRGQLIEESAIYPFGQVRTEISSRTRAESYLFTQKERDVETGLDYFDARSYVAVLSRFVRPDNLVTFSTSAKPEVLRSPQLLNTYAYVANRPTAAIDPSGEILANLFGAAVGGGAEYIAQVSANIAKNLLNGAPPLSGDVFTKINWSSVVIGAGVGFFNPASGIVRIAAKATLKEIGKEVAGGIIGAGVEKGVRVAGGSESSAEALGGLAKTLFLAGYGVYEVGKGAHEAAEIEKEFANWGENGSAFQSIAREALREGGSHTLEAFLKQAAEVFHSSQEQKERGDHTGSEAHGGVRLEGAPREGRGASSTPTAATSATKANRAKQRELERMYFNH